jgi:hypothetical protein
VDEFYGVVLEVQGSRRNPWSLHYTCCSRNAETRDRSGKSLSSGKTGELSGFLEEIEFHRVFYELSRPQDVLYSSIDGLFPHSLE